MKLFFLCFVLFFTTYGYSQTDSLAIEKDTIVVCTETKIVVPGTLKIYEDSYFNAVRKIQKLINKENCPKLIKGYRVQVFSCSGGSCKDKADKYYNQFLIAYPDLAVYKLWQPPSLKVRTGNCRTRFEAEGIKRLIEKDFPFVFIVPDYIDTTMMVDCDDMIDLNSEDSSK